MATPTSWAESTPVAPRTFDLSPTLNATSAVKKAGMSTTLPRNFAPLSLDPFDAPRTPDQTFAQLDLPPPPPHSTYRGRRPRLNLQNFHCRAAGLPATLFASDIPVPSSAGPWTTEFARANDQSSDVPMPSVEVEASTPTRPHLLQTYSEPMSSHRLRLHPMPQTPYTPPSQTVRAPTEIKPDEWDLRRPTSACSDRSDSSLSTSQTCETRPTSYNGSVTENELADPFSTLENIKIIPATPQRKNKKLRLGSFFSQANVEWTIEMDNHLFNMYQIYLADPTLTPFKTVPGSIPPTGVCHRVARRAKETWPRASRIDVPIVQRYRVRSMLDIRMTPREKTPDLDNFLSTTTDRRPQWPSESATRKRLKQLCREKFTITAHYNRLRESRSPSPFAEQFLPRKASRHSASPVLGFASDDGQAAYTTRDLHISLVATGATEPLAQLTTRDSPPPESVLQSFNRELDSAEQARIIPPKGLGIEQDEVLIDNTKLAPATTAPRLASPFSYNTWNGPIRPENHHRRQVSQHHFDTMHATGPRLLSPFESDGDAALNANKRRAQHNLEDELSPSGSSLAGHTSGLNLDEPLSDFTPQETKADLMFTGLGDLNQRRVRLRNRGATLGSAHERIARLFAPPPNQDTEVPPVPTIPAQFASISQFGLMPPKIDEGQRKLGSPFELDLNKRSLRNKPRHLPSLSDPFIQFTHGIPSGSSAMQQNGIGNIGDRLASFEQSLDEYKPSQL